LNNQHQRKNYGSSPRVWGTLTKERESVESRRFIPTGVGNICADAGKVFKKAVHPHGCGEHFLIAFLAIAARGSSPRVWGTYIWKNYLQDNTRFIPTGVGNIGKD